MIAKLVKTLIRFTKDEGPVAVLAGQLFWLAKRASALVLSDRAYQAIYSRVHLGRTAELDYPVTFNDKIQWLKLNDRSELYRTLVDKAAVRGLVKERVGERYLIPVHGIFDAVDRIDPGGLPDSFVLKPTHGSGWVEICRSKSSFDWDRARRRLTRWMRRDYYYHAREWAYRGLPRRVICETALLDADGKAPMDYKFFCFNGQATFVQVDADRFGDHRRNFYDVNWAAMDMSLLYPRAAIEMPKPALLAEMVEVANRLSTGFRFLRVDLYETPERVYFGELTLFPENGVGRFSPSSRDRELGDLIALNVRADLHGMRE